MFVTAKKAKPKATETQAAKVMAKIKSEIINLKSSAKIKADYLVVWLF
jgi:hypothetical protein